jgi:hypothetical protein
MSYKEKYFKYKLKYYALKKLIGGDDIKFDNTQSVTDNIDKIIIYLQENEHLNHKPLVLYNNMYWVNQYGGLCIQDTKNFYSRNLENKICISVVKNHIEKKYGFDVDSALTVFVGNNKIVSIPIIYYEKINIINKFIDEHNKILKEINDELKKIISNNLDLTSSKQTDMFKQNKDVQISNYKLSFTTDKDDLSSGTIIISDDSGKLIEATYQMGRGHFVYKTSIKYKIDNDSLLMKLKDITLPRSSL